MLCSLTLLAATTLQASEGSLPQEIAARPQIALRVPDIDDAWAALCRSPWARLLADDDLLTVARRVLDDPDATVSSMWNAMVEKSPPDDGLLEAIDLLSDLRSVTLGAAVGPGALDRPRNEWQLEQILNRGQVVLVLDVVDASAVEAWRSAVDGLLDRPNVREALGEAGTSWTVDGERLVLRLGDLSRTIGIEALDAALQVGPALPDAAGGVLADVWVAPFHELHLFEPTPGAIGLARLTRLLIGPQFAFVGGSGRMRVSVAPESGALVIDDARPLLPPESGDFLGRTPVPRETLALAHPEAWMATVASLDRDALEAALEGTVGEATSSEFVELLGGGVSISMPPLRGVAQIPPVFVAARHGGRDAMVRVTGKLCERAAAYYGGRVVLEQREYRDAAMFTFTAAPEIVPPGMETFAGLLRPTIAVTDDRVVATTAPVAMKKEIRRLRKDEATHAGLAAIAAPEGATTIGYVDWGETAARLCSIAMSMNALAGGTKNVGGSGPSLADVPWAELLRRHFPAGSRWSTVADGVRRSRSEASLDVAETLCVGSVVTIAIAFQMLAEDGSFAEAQTGVAKAQIARLGDAVDSHVLDHLECPASLAEVVVDGTVPLDPWGRPYAYRVDGSFEYAIWSFGPNGVDENGGGDDVSRRD